MRISTKTFLTTALLLIFLTLPHASSQQKLQQNTLAISNVTIIDTTGGPAKPNMTVLIPISISNEADARKAVASIGSSGADFMKVYSVIPREAYFALADEAKKRGITFAGHVPVSVNALEASDAGETSV
jgi:hypothetical protein